MKIRIKENVAARYIELNERSPQFSIRWLRVLEAIEGQTLDVDTDYLFKNQFNTKPIADVSRNGLRIMAYDVAEVMDDERPYNNRCGWCGNNSPRERDTCITCEKSEYLEPL